MKCIKLIVAALLTSSMLAYSMAPELPELTESDELLHSMKQELPEVDKSLQGYSKICLQGYPGPKPRSPFEGGQFTYYFVPLEFQIHDFRPGMSRAAEHCFVLLDPEQKKYVIDFLTEYVEGASQSDHVATVIKDLQLDLSRMVKIDPEFAEQFQQDRANKRVLLAVLFDLEGAGLTTVNHILEYVQDMENRQP